MMTYKTWLVLLAVAVAVPARAEEVKDAPKEKAKAVVLEAIKPEESDVRGKMGEPNFGYTGQLGSFQAARKLSTGDAPIGFLVVHHYPHVEQIALGQTKLKYVGARRLGNVDGWIFETDWDGKHYPSKMFFSAEPVYFGGGVVGYIAADYRNESGWVWKYHPLRRMELLDKKSAAD